MMKKADFLYQAIYRNPGRFSCKTTRNHDVFWQGKHCCSLNTKISQTISIVSYQLARSEYLIGENSNQKTKINVLKTNLFMN